MMLVNTPWQKVPLMGESAANYPKGHTLWARRCDGQHVFLLLPDGKTPGEGDSCYSSLPNAWKAGFQNKS